MDTTALILWQSYLQSTSADRREVLLRCLTPECIAEFEALPFISLEREKSIEPPEEALSKIHYSWLASFLRSLPENEIKLFLAPLTPEQIKGLRQTLLLSSTLPTPSALGKEFLQKTLFETIAAEDLLPISLLPQDPLNGLLDLTFEELNSLIDLLSMHDLSIEIRHIIETSKLKEIYGLLSKAQTTFLKTLLHKR